MIQVSQKTIESFFEKYAAGKSNKEYGKILEKENPYLCLFLLNTLEDMEVDLLKSLPKSKVDSFIKSVDGLLVCMYSLLKEQEECNELEKIYG